MEPYRKGRKMTGYLDSSASEEKPARDTGALLLAAGGLAAAFGAASCCALPLLLGSLGLGSAWLLTVAWFAAPHRIALLAVAIVCLASGAGVLFWRHRWNVACGPHGPCARSQAITLLASGALSFGAILAVLGFIYA